MRFGQGARDGDYARVRLRLIIIPNRTALIDPNHTHTFSEEAEFIRGIWRRYHALATDGDTSNAFGIYVLTLFVAPLQRHVTELLGVSAQMQGVSARERLDAVFAVTVWTALRKWCRQQLVRVFRTSSE